MKKKILALGLVVCMLVVAIGSATMAYFTDSDQATNVFTVGKIDVEIEEEVGVTDGQGNDVSDDRVTQTENGAIYTGIMPGNKMDKKVTVKNTGDAPAYIRVAVIMNKHLELWEVLEEAIDLDTVMTPAEKVAAKDALYDEIFLNWGITFDGAGWCGAIIPDDVNGLDAKGLLYVDNTIDFDSYNLFDVGNVWQSDA